MLERHVKALASSQRMRRLEGCTCARSTTSSSRRPPARIESSRPWGADQSPWVQFLHPFCVQYISGCDSPPRPRDHIPMKGVSQKRERQYEHIKESEMEKGRSEEEAERIAAATVNKTRREKGETKDR
jgi:hypothetical protein